MNVRDSVLQVLESRSATHEELARTLDRPAGTIRRVTQELRAEGKIAVETLYDGSYPVFSIRKPTYVVD